MTEAQEIERLRNVLRMQHQWIRHWQEDVRLGLKPTRDSLHDAEDAILEALRNRRKVDA